MTRLEVNLPSGSYSIMIEPGVLARVGKIARDTAPHDRAMLVFDRNIHATHAATAERSLIAAGYSVARYEIESSEHNKVMRHIEVMCSQMISHRLERQSPVVAVGGGVVGDMAGFAAAVYLRGVPVIQVPTTLLAMVDASIGGKTGVNAQLPNATLVKNMIGAFWQPRAVVADPNVLRTLEPREVHCGLAECVKHGMIADAGLLEFIASSGESIESCDPATMTALIARSAKIKVDIVQQDERESGRRALLNLGHTFAHAIEPIEQLHLRHGEAVAIGLMAACRCSVDTGRMTAAESARIGSLLLHCKLPVWLPKPVSAARLREAMGHDKKVKDGRMRLILPVGLGAAEVVTDVPESLVDAALHEIGAVL